MRWTTYKDLLATEKRDETYYIIGLDIGNESTSIAYYNLHENAPEAIDLSGGYGKPSIPTVMQYILETKEWVFGEYAILNQGSGSEINLRNLLPRLGKHEYLEINKKAIQFAEILAIFIKEVLSNVRNINPKAEIAGIIASIPDNLNHAAQQELKEAFKLAGYEKELIDLVPNRECALAYHNRNHPLTNSKILLLDYGSGGVRGGVYENGKVALSNIFNNKIGTSPLLADVNSFFSQKYKGERSLIFNSQLFAFTHQHKDMLFQKNIRTKPIKLYYNFVYPPFQQTIAHEHVSKLIEPYVYGFNRLISDVLSKNTLGKRILPRDIDAVLCTGGGFEMLWAREAIADIFSQSQIHMYRNPKLIIAEGAAQTAAFQLGIAPGQPFDIVDNHKLAADIGIKSGDNFLPLALGESYWWQAHEPTLVLANENIGDKLNLTITQKSPDHSERILASPTLTGLPKRKKGTTCLSINTEFISNTKMKLKVSDIGFGEISPKTDYQEELVVNLA